MAARSAGIDRNEKNYATVTLCMNSLTLTRFTFYIVKNVDFACYWHICQMYPMKENMP